MDRVLSCEVRAIGGPTGSFRPSVQSGQIPPKGEWPRGGGSAILRAAR